MKLSDFDFNLPKELVAQYPTPARDGSRLLALDKNTGEIADKRFSDLIDFLQPGDLLVMNNSKVIKACLTLNKNNSKIHINLNKPLKSDIWHGFAKPAKKLSIGDVFDFGDNQIIIHNKQEDGSIEFKFHLPQISIFEFLNIYGEMPLPSYIRGGKAESFDDERYQTIYSKNEGSVAAPTAGLHFTDELLLKLKDRNIDICFVTLHVGAGTFLPVKTEQISEHKMHSEYGEISLETAQKINHAKAEGRRVIAVGTTSVRTLESGSKNGELKADNFETDIFITPGYKFKTIDGLITNFHLPKSTLLMLVSAFAGYGHIMQAYKYAVDNNYRFFSYGDAMLIL